ncbi:hypothetical protein [Niveispirillum sp.]|uniref:hypothetical protein n=1 Tax=Niveispirillum sp. TaxID=1917217 RepID=UPI001B6ED81B|nr:hypothetical protein [Niveispirillum sp.]MBP7338264.1 hypothetical protein [Niveispirillum sp.]
MWSGNNITGEAQIVAKDQYKPDASALAGLFDRLRDLPFPAEAGAGSAAFRLDAGDQAGLAAMLAALGPMFVEMKTAGAFANPWTVGGGAATSFAIPACWPGFWTRRVIMVVGTGC